MAAQYTPVTLAEMVELLKPEKGWHEVALERVREHVLDWRVQRFKAHIVVRVYTSVKKTTGTGRGCGKDAIRVCAVNLDTDRGLVASKRVHRVENWRTNLQKRIAWVIEQLEGQGHTMLTREQRKARREAEAGGATIDPSNGVPVKHAPANVSDAITSGGTLNTVLVEPGQRPSVRAHDWKDAPANVAGCFDENGDLDEDAPDPKCKCNGTGVVQYEGQYQRTAPCPAGCPDEGPDEPGDEIASEGASAMEADERTPRKRGQRRRPQLKSKYTG
jgi:hypothetical protein